MCAPPATAPVAAARARVGARVTIRAPRYRTHTTRARPAAVLPPPLWTAARTVAATGSEPYRSTRPLPCSALLVSPAVTAPADAPPPLLCSRSRRHDDT